MSPIDPHSLLLLATLVGLVSLASLVGMLLNRIITYRAHRRALYAIRHDELSLQSIPLTISRERIVRNEA